MRRSGTFRRTLIIAAILVCAGRVSLGADWPRFRGPNGTGISTDTNIPTEIGEEKNLLWKVEIPGVGNSSPIVSGGKIFLQSATDEGRERRLICLDSGKGAVNWQRSVPGNTAKKHAKNTLAACTAAADGKRVFVPFWDGHDLSMAAYDFEGKPLWSVPLGAFPINHGAGHSPIVVGDKVVFVKDQDQASEIIAFDAGSGRIAWRFDRPASRSTCFSTPLLRERAGETPEIVVVSSVGVTGYDSASGSEKWAWAWTGNKQNLRTVGSPIISQGMVFLTGGNGPGARHAVGVRLDGESGNPGSAHQEWETLKLYPYVPSMLARGEHLYFVNDAGIAACALARTGEIVWQQRLGIGNVTASPLLIDGKIYTVSENGQIKVFAAETAYREIAEGKLDEGVLATPAVADGRLLIRGSGHLYCFGTR